MAGNIIYIGRYLLPRECRSAGAKRMVNQATYLRKKFDLLIITFSSLRSGLPFCKDFYIPKKNKVLYSFVLPFYWLYIFFILLKRRRNDRKNYLVLETCSDFFTIIPIFFAKLLGYKVIHDVLEDFLLLQEELSFKQKLHQQLKKVFHKCVKYYADGFIVISDRLYTKYKKLNVPIIKLYNSIEPAEINTNRRSNAVFTFYYSGTFTTKDGVIDLINAFNIVEKKFPATKLVLVGKGHFSSFTQCLSLIKNNKKIEYLGFLPEDRMFNELSNSNLCCITRINSEYANNGFPFKLAEYSSFGKPILSTDVSDIATLFTNKKDILLAEPGNPESISHLMEYAIKNQDEMMQIGENGKIICNRHFSIEYIGEKLGDFFSQLS